jgi:hypothetical protein
MKTRIIFALTVAVAFNTFAAPTLQYSGTVRDSSGAPAAGVRVELYPGFYIGAGHYTEVKTDANERYEIIQQPELSGLFWGPPNPTNSIMVRDFERDLAAIQEFDRTATNIDLILRPAITLSGFVKNIQGEPVGGAELDIRFLSGNSMTLLSPHPIKTDEAGQFSIPALPQSREYWIDEINAKGYGSGFARAEAKDTQTNRYEFPTFVLKHADRKLAGQVLDSDGKPLAGAHVIFFGRGQPQNSNTNTDGKGYFAFDSVCEGKVNLTASWIGSPGSGDFMSFNGSGMEVQAGDTNIFLKLYRH